MSLSQPPGPTGEVASLAPRTNPSSRTAPASNERWPPIYIHNYSALSSPSPQFHLASPGVGVEEIIS